MTPRLEGLVAATHTPFGPDGSLNLRAVEHQAAHLLAHGVRVAFVGGTTGECSSLTVDERVALATRWVEVARGTALDVIVHVGANSLEDARALGAHAQRIEARAVSAVAPSYAKPAGVAALVASMAHVAAAAPDLPFYYYEIPSLTGVGVSPSAFLEAAAGRIPTLAGIKFASTDFVEYQLCREACGGRFEMPYGFDEMLLAALALGATSAVGSSYNFAAPLYLRLIDAFRRGDLEAARAEQARSVRLIRVLASFGYMAAAKAVMRMVGVDVGGPRLPVLPLSHEDERRLRADVERLGAV